MIAYGENIQVFCGNSNPQFAQTICKELGVPMGKAIVTHFADGGNRPRRRRVPHPVHLQTRQ